MAITATDVITATSSYIPPENQLSDSELEDLADRMIELYGSDDEDLGKVCCEFLKAVGVVNGTLTVISDGNGNLKREKLGKQEKEWYNSANNNWDAYTKKVNGYICPIIFGVEGKFVIGAKYNSAEKTPIIDVKTSSDWNL